MPKIAFLMVLLSFTGCTLSQATETARAANDKKARLLIDSTCDMGIGAWNRLDNPNEQVGAMLLCGGQTNDLLSIRAGSIQFE